MCGQDRIQFRLTCCQGFFTIQATVVESLRVPRRPHLMGTAVDFDGLGIYLTAMKEEGRALVTVLDSGSGRVDAEEDLMFSDLLGLLNVGDESFEVSIGDI